MTDPIDYDALLASADSWSVSGDMPLAAIETMHQLAAAIRALRAAAAESSLGAERFNAVIAIAFNEEHPITKAAEKLPPPRNPYEFIEMIDKAMAAQEKANG